MKESEDMKRAKSLFAEYQRFMKRAETPNLPQIEKDYTMSMVYSTKSRIDWDLLNHKRKENYESY